MPSTGSRSWPSRGGAAALAAALFRADQIEGDDVIVTVSGGNVDAPMFIRALQTLG